MSVKLLPTTILVDNDGTILFRHQGYSPGDEKIILKHITDYFDENEVEYNSVNLKGLIKLYEIKFGSYIFLIKEDPLMLYNLAKV